MHQVNIHRRSFLKRTSLAGGGLMLSFLLPDFAIAKNEENDCEFFQPNAYLKIDKKGLVTLFVPKQEMGQGVNTSLPMIVAEELDADWKNVKIEIAPHGTLKPGESSTGGSNAVRGMWQPLRKAGATAKAMLIGAAAKMWDVKPEQCAADKGIVMNMVNMQTITYGELVCDAAKMPIPENVTLKKIDEFKIIGKAEKKSNLKEIITGKAKYGIDVQLQIGRAHV